MNPPEDDLWISETSQVEELYEQAHKKGTFLLAYQLSVSSVKPLEEGQVRQAFVHLQRKCPNLRVCYGKRNGVTWFKRSTNEDIDFQVVKGVEAEDIRNLLHTYQYNSETGPLWCARLLMEARDKEYALDEGLPYTSQIFIGMHHGITDGISLLKILGAFITILNDVISEKTIDDEEQIAPFASDTEQDKLVSLRVAVIKNNPSLMQDLTLNAKDKGIGMPLLVKFNPPPEESEDRMHHITHILDQATTDRFIARCKSEGMTVHSGVTAIANASVVSLLIKRQYIKETYRLANGHIINLRRYWPSDRSQVLGCHAHAPLCLWSQPSKDILCNFWDFARSIHKDLHHHLNSETILLREAYQSMNTIKQEVNLDDVFLFSEPSQLDLVFSNLGDATAVIGEGGPHVKPYLLVRHASLHRTNIKNLLHFFHTFRGRFILNLLFNTKFITSELAQEYCNKLFATMEEVLK